MTKAQGVLHLLCPLDVMEWEGPFISFIPEPHLTVGKTSDKSKSKDLLQMPDECFSQLSRSSNTMKV